MDDTQYKPFVPETSPKQPMFEEGKPAVPPAADKPTKPKRERKPRPQPRATAPKIPPAPKHKRPTRKKKKITRQRRASTIKPGPVAQVAAAVARGEARRKAKKPRELKMPFSDAMAISALLKPADFKMFESLTETLQGVNKATRRRVLAAIGKVFG